MIPHLPDGLPEPVDARPLGGGSICQVWQVQLADGRTAVVKQTPYAAEIEVDGLEALRRAGAPVPSVYAADPHVLVLEHVTGPADWAGLGRAVAELHRHTEARDSPPAFGWHRDNLIGSLDQRNDPDSDWARFYVEQRIRPYLGLPALPGSLALRLRRALEGPMLALLDHDPPPSLVHGDLWSGNVVDGRWLIDPAVHHADRELDLAFADLFGGLPEAFTQAYHETWPLEAGWQQRRPALQLYHLLVHVAIFGSGYVGAVQARLDALGW